MDRPGQGQLRIRQRHASREVRALNSTAPHTVLIQYWQFDCTMPLWIILTSTVVSEVIYTDLDVRVR